MYCFRIGKYEEESMKKKNPPFLLPSLFFLKKAQDPLDLALDERAALGVRPKHVSVFRRRIIFCGLSSAVRGLLS